jgi:hypothetical protein
LTGFGRLCRLRLADQQPFDRVGAESQEDDSNEAPYEIELLDLFPSSGYESQQCNEQDDDQSHPLGAHATARLLAGTRLGAETDSLVIGGLDLSTRPTN